jgi:thioredoxin reductase (NADPH)
MGVPGEIQFWQRGISACAVCDGALPMFRNKTLVVVGGGDSALEEANHLTHFGSEVVILVRRDVFRASKAMQERILNNPKIRVLRNTELKEATGEQFLTGVKIINNKTNEETLLPCAGLFYAIGHTPNTAFLEGQLEVDEVGYIITKPGTTKTSKE